MQSPSTFFQLPAMRRLENALAFWANTVKAEQRQMAAEMRPLADEIPAG
jgi:hypothetical protein